MDPAIKQRLDGLQDRLEQLRTAITRTNVYVERQDEERDQLRQERWGYVKRLNTLNRIAEDYEEVATQNERMTKERAELFERLKKVHNFTKLLTAQYRP
jgi:chromosome segregation ATPase